MSPLPARVHQLAEDSVLRGDHAPLAGAFCTGRTKHKMSLRNSMQSNPMSWSVGSAATQSCVIWSASDKPYCGALCSAGRFSQWLAIVQQS